MMKPTNDHPKTEGAVGVACSDLLGGESWRPEDWIAHPAYDSAFLNWICLRADLLFWRTALRLLRCGNYGRYALVCLIRTLILFLYIGNQCFKVFNCVHILLFPFWCCNRTSPPNDQAQAQPPEGDSRRSKGLYEI
jgi:hypothetical protein